MIRFETEADAIRITNDAPDGLAGAIWKRDVFKGIRVLVQVRAGILWLNTYHPTYNEAPWGGYKQSGFGRELGPYGLENYLETRQININLTEAPLAASAPVGGAGASSTYQPRRAEESVLYGIVQEHLATFLAHVRDTCEAPLPRYVVDTPLQAVRDRAMPTGRVLVWMKGVSGAGPPHFFVRPA